MELTFKQRLEHYGVEDALGIEPDVPAWYRNRRVLEAYWSRVVFVRFESYEELNALRAPAADAWLQIENDPSQVESLQQYVDTLAGARAWNVRDRMNEDVQWVRRDRAWKERRELLDANFESLGRQFLREYKNVRPGTERDVAALRHMAEKRTQQQREERCERQGFCEWYGRFHQYSVV